MNDSRSLRVLRSATWALVLTAIVAMGCQHTLPPGYVKVDPPWGFDFRAVSADGSALTSRIEENPENGDLAFWEKAITSRLVDVRGYQLAERTEVTLAQKTPGIEMTFDYTRDGIDYLYLLNLCVKGDRVRVFEAAGEKEKIVPELSAIREAIREWPL